MNLVVGDFEVEFVEAVGTHVVGEGVGPAATVETALGVVAEGERHGL